MSSNSFGKLLTVTTFGESHGPAIGCVIDGCPPGLEIHEDEFAHDLARRATGRSRQALQWQLELDSAEARADLLAMTPHGWRATEARREALIAKPLSLTLALRNDWLQRI